jgi:hypothetical protein
VDPGGKLAFEGSSSRKQPERKQQKHDGTGFEKEEYGLPKDVAPDQGAIEINAQNRAHRPRGFDSRDIPHGIIVA